MNEGDQLNRGGRYGFIRFGSRVDVYLPLDAVANVVIGEKVSASSTILARLPLQAPTVVNTSAPAPAPASEAPDIAEVKENNGNAEQALVTEAAENIHNAVEKEMGSS